MASRITACPQCGANTQRSAEQCSDKNAFFPFCSERCRMLDLGAWASGRYVIKGHHSPASSSHAEEDAHDMPPPGLKPRS